MREIKFRCFDKQTKQMSPPFTLFGEFLLIGAVHAWQYECGNDVKDSLEALKDLEVMQFTGLKDKHGKMIYEGDILKGFYFGARQLKGGPSYMLGKVTFWAGMWALEPFVKYEPNADLYDAFHYCEIVGNEFENPELCQ